MNSEQILQRFNEIADRSDAESAVLVRQLGELFYARLRHTTEVYEQLGKDFQSLSTSVIERLRKNEQRQDAQLELLVDKMHTIGNRFMSVENKVDELAETVMQYFAANEHERSTENTD